MGDALFPEPIELVSGILKRVSDFVEIVGKDTSAMSSWICGRSPLWPRHHLLRLMPGDAVSLVKVETCRFAMESSGSRGEIARITRMQGRNARERKEAD